MRSIPERLACVTIDALRQCVDEIKQKPKRSLKDEKRLCELYQSINKLNKRNYGKKSKVSR